MKNNNKGFIAISLIYSFFLVFLVTILMVVMSYAKNRILLNHVKNATQEYLNGLAEFNPVSLENKNYTTEDVVKLGSEMWQVVSDDEGIVTLVLNRDLTNEEITTIITELAIPPKEESEEPPAEVPEETPSLYNEEGTLMCLPYYSPIYCNYESNTVYNPYTWDTSLVKQIVENWFFKDALLQKGVNRGTIVLMEYQDRESTEAEETAKTYNTYVRIPLASEYEAIKNDDIWYLTSSKLEAGMSYLKQNTTDVSAHNTNKKIRPVIQIQKPTA